VLTLRDDGNTEAEVRDADMPEGTRIEVSFGPTLPHDGRDDEGSRHPSHLTQLSALFHQ
jgi:hypothetical protein